MKLSLSGVVATVLMSFSACALAADGNSLSVQLSASSDKAAPSESVLWQITNRSSENLYVLRWETPLDGMSRSVFDVSLNGVPVRYMDKVVHWGHPEAKDFVKIAPGQTLSAEVNLAASYEMVDGGSYTVGFEGQLSYVVAEDAVKGKVEELGSAQLAADPVSVYSAGRSPAFYSQLGASTGPLSFTKAATYANCSSSRQTTTAAAHTQAKTYASNGLSYLNAGSTGARYTTWFGSYTSSRYSTVKSHFTKISGALNNSTVTYDCYCEPNLASAYAYVYPSQPYTIHVCNAFWAAPNSGTDSRGGTIVHEMSHFTVNGGTQDHVYGQTGAKNLARTNPKKAVANADNHEYFAENTPFQN
jgi:peptidyl-Lys metalloendopeptidase